MFCNFDSIIVPHVQDALYFRRKLRALYYVNAIHVFLFFIGFEIESVVIKYISDV